MYCANCGTEIAYGSSFCSNCGTAIAAKSQEPSGAQGQAMSFDDYKAYDTYKTAVNCAATAEAEYLGLRTSFIRCCILGVICAVFAGYWCTTIDHSTVNDAFYVVFSAILFVFPAFCAPFGLLLLLNWVKDHGVAIWISILFAVLLCFIVVLFAMFAGIPYCVYMIYRMRKAKKTHLEAEDFLRRARAAAGA